MRGLVRNRKKFYYAKLSNAEPVVNAQGFYTGETQRTLTNPILAYANLSSSSGTAIFQPFGHELAYDKTIFVANPAFDIDEHSVLWLETMPVIEEDESTATPYDYVVKRVSRGLNGMTIAVERVDANA